VNLPGEVSMYQDNSSLVPAGSIGILNIGIGNIPAIRGCLRRLAVKSVSVERPIDLLGLSHLILPGVGSMHELMLCLHKTGLDQAIRDFASHGFILGICLGFQAFYEYSEEGQCECLGLLQGSVVPYSSYGRSTTNIGYSRIEQCTCFENNRYPIIAKDLLKYYYYFTHSFCVPIYSSTTHILQVGDQSITAASRQGNIYGTQFHPELSHAHGRSLIQEFLRLSY
jgi:glutamine amidotransferase